MVAVVDAVALVGLVVANTALVALMTRFFRVRLDTRVGSLLYTVVLCPFVLLVAVLFVGGVLGLGPDLGSATAVGVLTIALPLAAGIAFDYFWMPAPGEVDLPERWEREEPDRYER